MSEQPQIQFTEIGNVGIVTLNRPQALNALTHDMVIELHEQLDEWEKEKDVLAVLIQGAGEKAFCAGGDIRKIYDAKNDRNLEIMDFFWDEYRLNHRIFHYPKPYIALLDGVTMGGGVGVSIHGKYRVATERFMFAMPETGIGFFPDIGGSYFLSRCPGQTGIYLGLTGDRIKTADADYLGLINYYVNTEKLPEMVDVLVSTNLESPADKNIESIFTNLSGHPGNSVLADYRNDIDYCFQQETIEEIIAALQTRKNEWCDNVVATLRKKSPTSLKVTLQQLRNGKSLTLDECLKMEYRMVLRFLQGHDFYEGVRAVIVDKDQNPKWQPSELSEVTQEMVEAYFAPLKGRKELSFD